MTQRPSRPNPAILAIASLLLFAACWAAAGPLPGDLEVTLALQDIFGADPRWAHAITHSAKLPWLVATAGIVVGLQSLRGGWRTAVEPLVALAIAQALDAALRVFVHVPRPSPDLVAVAAPAASSGLPSTFGLVYGALFGACLRLPARRRSRSRERRFDRPIFALAWLAIFAGAIGRIVLGGHWPSQMLASMLLGAAIAITTSALGRRFVGST